MSSAFVGSFALLACLFKTKNELERLVRSLMFGVGGDDISSLVVVLEFLMCVCRSYFITMTGRSIGRSYTYERVRMLLT